MLNSFFSKFEFRPLKFGLNSNLVYIFVEKLKQFAFDVCIVGWDEGRSTHAARQEAVCQQCNQPGRQAMSRSKLPSIDVCSVSGPPRFVTLIACISIQHAPGVQCKTESNWTLQRYAERGGRRGVSKHTASVTWIDSWQRTKKSSHSALLK